MQRRWVTVAGLLLVLGGRAAFHFARPYYSHLEVTGRAWVNVAFAWGLTLALLALIRFGERLPLESIGLRRMNRRDAWWAFAAFLAGGAIISGTIPLIRALGLRTVESGVQTLGQLPIELRVCLVLTAGITEEIRYRGYLIERVHALSGRLGLSVVISYLAFVAAHLPFWTLGGAIQIGLGSLVLYALYLKRRNLPACMLMHVLNDALAFLLIPGLLPQR